MVATQSELITMLAERVPALKEMYDEHLEFYEELLPSVYFGELVPWVVGDYLASTKDTAHTGSWREVLSILEREYHSGLEVEQLIDTSFLETLPYPGEEGYGLVEALGPNLRQALLTDVSGRPEAAPPSGA